MSSPEDNTEYGENSNDENNNDKNNNVSKTIEELEKEVEVMKKKLDDMHKKDEEIKALEEKIEDMKSQIEKQKEKIDRLRLELEEKTSKFNTENKIVVEKLEALTKENNELKRRLEELESNQKILALGQVAFVWEKMIWKAVLPDEKMGKTGIFKSMEHWLKKNSSSPKGKAAQKRWDNLKDELKWNDEDHRFALSLLKKIRLKVAHPEPVDLKKARKQLKDEDHVADADKDLCGEIIDMVETLETRNRTL